jgi:hypothetical protein
MVMGTGNSIVSKLIVPWWENLKNDFIMLKTIKILKYTIVIVIIILFTSTGCASAKKTRFTLMNKETVCDLSHLGRNKYFYSAYYQRKLINSTKKISSR